MQRKQVESSMIKSVGYDENNLILEVEFKNGKVFQYLGVKPMVFEEFSTSGSIGKNFHRMIKSKYDFKEV